jgi:hypothetical protein
MDEYEKCKIVSESIMRVLLWRGVEIRCDFDKNASWQPGV